MTPTTTQPVVRRRPTGRQVAAVLLLVPISAGFAVLASVAVTTLDGFRAPLDDAVRMALALGGLGVITGVIGVVGALLAMRIVRRSSPPVRARIGAAIAILVVWWGYAVLFFLAAANYNVLGALIGAVGLVAAAVGGLVAGLLVTAADRGGSRGPSVTPRVGAA